MANANLQNIYNRLNGTASYHPYTADTYADCSLEAGDIVTVSRDGRSYSSPIHSTTVRWNGHHRVSVESRGEKERGSIAKMSARTYNSGGSSVRGAGRAGSGRRKLEDEVDEIEGTELWVNRDNIAAVSGKYRVDKDGKLHIIEGSGLYMDRGNASFGLYDEGNLTGGIMVQKINDQTVTRINGHRIEIGGKDAVTVIEGKLDAKTVTADFIGAILTNTSVLSTRYAFSSTLECNTFIHDGYTCSVSDAIKSIQIVQSGNNYTLQAKHFYSMAWETVPGGNFSRAITDWSGSWSGGTYTATAKPQNQTHKVTIKQLRQTGNVSPIITPSSQHVSQKVEVYASYGKSTSNSTNTGFSAWVTIDASSAYQAGKNSVTPESHTFAGYFSRYGTVNVEGKNYMAYYTDNTSANWSHQAVYI